MLRSKDAAGYMRPLAAMAEALHAVEIAGEAATLSAEETAAIARSVGLAADIAASPAEAVARIAGEVPGARILICGSLYLAGQILRENG